jgi:hypothetical protein
MSDPVVPQISKRAGGDDEKQSQSLKADLTLQGTITVPPRAQSTANGRQTESNNNRRDPILNRYSVIGSLVLAGMLVIVGSLQTCILSRQATIMDKQATIASDANRQNAIVNRAFVYFNRMNYAFTPDQNDWDFEAMAVWGNSGNTPTTHLYQAIGCLPSKDVVKEPFDKITWPTSTSAECLRA